MEALIEKLKELFFSSIIDNLGMGITGFLTKDIKNNVG
jgi:hypothetical protein